MTLKVRGVGGKSRTDNIYESVYTVQIQTEVYVPAVKWAVVFSITSPRTFAPETILIFLTVYRYLHLVHQILGVLTFGLQGK